MNQIDPRINLMIRNFKLFIYVSAMMVSLTGKLFAADDSAATDQAVAPHSHDRETLEERNGRMAWWRNARFGMFIHWGIYAVPAQGEWYMNNAHVPRDTYAQYATQFNPTNFDAEQWAKIAKAAGIKYLVITSKHHDGFCMFDTKATDYNVVDATPWHKDPLKALSEACRKNGIQFCVYYSIMDWHNPHQAPAYNPTSFVPGDKEAYIQYMKTELGELVTQYHPGVLWFDGQWMNGWTEQDGQEIYRYLRELEPDIIVNDRVKGAGDYGTPEQYIPPTGLPGQDWESCMTINGSWGYNESDHNFKSTEALLRNLIDIASKGGNYLLNVGPDSTGIIPEPEVERLREMGTWMKVNGEAIYGTTASPISSEYGTATMQKDGYGQARPASSEWDWRCTKKVTPDGVTLYLEIFNWPKDGKFLVPGLQNKITNAYLLEHNFYGGHKHLETANSDNGAIISVPAVAPDKIASVVVLKVKGALDIR
jgi:alpha-L-fucosidase